jgi:hypothetical protein
MYIRRMGSVAGALGAAVLFFASPALLAQSVDPKAAPRAQGGETEGPKRVVDEFAEAEKLLSGAAGNPECVWLGRRAVSLLWRDDLDTAFRHLDLYDRFGCPAGHIQTSFRCVVRQGPIDPKDPKAPDLEKRINGCWINPSTTPPAAAAAAAAPSQAQ